MRNSARKFRNMLESISPVQETTTWDVVEETNSAAESTPAVVSVTFTQAFKKNQYHEQVKTLQTVLKNWWYYNGEITGVYSPATIEAVYHFQLKEGIITGNEKDKSAYGWFGTATRARMNALLQ
jgi:peptidoglycan hydrolase-like protein with peptidoglycan-binding domain